MFEKDLKKAYLLDFYGEVLTERKKEVLDMYYNEDLSLAEIADQIGISRQGVRDLIKRGELQLKKYEDECGWCQNVLALQSVIDSDKPDSEKLDKIKDILNEF